MQQILFEFFSYQIEHSNDRMNLIIQTVLPVAENFVICESLLSERIVEFSQTMLISKS